MNNNFFQNCTNVQIVCSLSDLRQLFKDWYDEQREKEQQQSQQQKKGKYLTTIEVCRLLDVTKPTLWRWQKLNYLVPIKVGRKNFYKSSDIEKLRE